MNSKSDAARAEELSRKRARALPVLGVLFISQQLVFFSSPARDRMVDHVHIGAWLILSVVMLLALTTGGGWIYPRSVRQLANDEATRVHRDDAFRYGFLAAMVACIALYVVTLFEPFGEREAIHLILTVGIGMALLRFGLLERRAMRDA
ncbi:MAG TPA: hypothetical protein VHN55_02005 [Sphingomicrobium sp.]|nr:hypothetical protein [Sphingomicrobium sp.]